MTEVKNKVAPLMGGGGVEPSSEYTVYLTKDKTLTGFLKEEYNYDGVYGPIPDEDGLVDLRYYSTTYISHNQDITTIPKENQEYLDSGLKASDMFYMFAYGRSLTSLDLSKIDTSNVTDMSYMFFCCESLTNLDLSNFDTSKVIYMPFMFQYCYALTSLDLSNFDTSNVINMMNMFATCTSLTSLDLSNFDTSKVINMSNMFSNCESLTTIIGSLDTSSCTNCDYMFTNSNNLKGVHLRNVSRNLDFSNSGGIEGQHYIIDNYID